MIKIKTYKIIFTILLSLLITISSLPNIISPVLATQDGDYIYELINNDANVRITGYKGSDGYISLPSTIEGKSVTSIGTGAFMGCTSLTSVIIPDSVSIIDSAAFESCYNLTNITISNSLTSIVGFTFANCSSLSTIAIPGSVLTIDMTAFINCSSLMVINVNKNNANYSSIDGVLFEKTKLIVYPEGRTEVSYVIPESTTSIGDNAFNRCRNIVSITISDNVKAIGKNVFDGCNSLSAINVGEGNTSFASIDGVLLNKKKAQFKVYPVGKTTTSYSIPDNVTSIAPSAFAYCTNLQSVTIPDTVKSIGDNAFSYCSSLKTITISNSSSLTDIGMGTFMSCANLNSITLPESLTKIGNIAFEGCSSLTSITIPNNLSIINMGTFVSCSKLDAITIPSSVVSIIDMAFADCNNLKVYGEVNSYAQQYATVNNIPFIGTLNPTSEPSTTVTPTSVTTVTPTPTSLIYSDIVGFEWAYYAIINLTNTNVILGYGDCTFRPDKNITRAEFTKMVTIAFGQYDPDRTYEGIFTDVQDGKWYTPFIETASNIGLVNGTRDGFFEPDLNITRQEAVMIIANAIALFRNTTISELAKDYTLPFSDTLANDWTIDGIKTCSKLGIIRGYPDGTFKPKDFIIRAESVIIVNNFIKYISDSTPASSPTDEPSPTVFPTATPTISPVPTLVLPTLTPTPSPTGVQIWISQINDSNSGMSMALSPQQDANFVDDCGTAEYTFNVDPNITYQEMDGFGASFTEASSYLIESKLTPENRNNLMNDLFDKNTGIGISMLRQPIGAADHVLAPYNYVPKEDTDDLPNFSINHDEKYIIPSIQHALSVNPGRIKVICATWSPPGWMKNNNSELGSVDGLEGRLTNYKAYANYITKFILSYNAAGIPIYATTIQNEPDYASQTWPAMTLSSKQATNLVNNYLYPSFQSSNLSNVKIIGWDHNFNNSPNYPYGKYAMDILGADKNNHFAGTAWHWYSDGEEQVLNDVHNAFPNKGIWFTEGSGGNWGSDILWKDAFDSEMQYVIRLSRDWSKSVIWWNIALDENNGPDYYYMNYAREHSTCRGLVQINQKTGAITKFTDYYTMGHISKFVDPGAFRIDSNTFKDDMESVAFKNPDNSKVLIVYNQNQEDKKIKVKCATKSFIYTIPKGAAATIKWFN